MIDWYAIWECVKDCGTEIFKIIGTSTVIVGAAAWFLRKVIGKRIDLWYDKKNKDYQDEIDKKAREQQLLLDQQLSDYKTALDNKSKAVQNSLDTQLELARIEYGSLYEKRITAINTFYDWIALFDMCLRAVELMDRHNVDSIFEAPHSLSESQLGRILDLENEVKRFNQYYINNKLFLPKQTAQKIDIIAAILLSKAMTIRGKDKIIESYEAANGVADDARLQELTREYEFLNSIYVGFSEIETDLNDILIEIEDEFRHLIGSDIKRD